MLPLDLVELLHKRMAHDREPDGLLHASSHLTGSLRHAMLEIAGAPTNARPMVENITLHTGTMWHTWISGQLRDFGLPFMDELNLTPFMPKGWSGTADWVIYHPDYRAFVLGDLKTIKGEGLWWIQKDGAKVEHLWQLSAYWHALMDMGIPLIKGFFVLYWPKTVPDGAEAYPSVQECEPLPRDVVHGRMIERRSQVDEYLSSLPGTDFEAGRGIYLTDKLAPVQERVQKMNWDKAAGLFQVKLVPHWSTAYCPFPDDLCDCNTQGTTKIGHYTVEGEYVPRKVYGFKKDGTQINPQVSPTPADLKRRKREVDSASDAD